MYNALLHSHSGLRWIFLFLILGSIVRAVMGLTGNRSFDSLDNRLSLFSLIAAHLMLVIGVVLYFVSPIVQAGLIDMGSTMKNPIHRFWVIEHSSIMVIGIVLITLGRTRLKKIETDAAKHKHILIYFGIGLILILSRIPWPFMANFSHRGWF